MLKILILKEHGDYEVGKIYKVTRGEAGRLISAQLASEASRDAKARKQPKPQRRQPIKRR